MNDEKHALVIRVDSIDLGIDSPQVINFDAKGAAEDFAVDVLVNELGLYAKLKKDGCYYNDDGDRFKSKAEVISDFNKSHLDSGEEFQVVPARDHGAETNRDRRRQELADVLRAAADLHKMVLSLSRDTKEQEVAVATTAVAKGGTGTSSAEGTEAKSAAVYVKGERSCVVKDCAFFSPQTIGEALADGDSRPADAMVRKFRLADEAKGKGERKSPDCTDASPVARTDADGRIEESSGCPHCQRERLQDESRPSPLSSLSESEYGSMVGAVDAFFLRRPEVAIRTLANVAHVTIEEMRAYVARADHLVLYHCDFVRRVSG